MDVIAAYKSSRDNLLRDQGLAYRSSKIATKGPVSKVHYLELGKGKPLILIHGGGSHAGEWIPILKPLSAHFHLYVVDRPGCGLTDGINYRGVDVRQSAVAFVGSFLDALGLDKALLMAQSMGGYFSICFAQQYPQRVEKLLLIGAPAGMNLWIPYLLRLLGTKGLNRALIRTVAKPSIKNVKNIHQQLLVADLNHLSDDYFRHSYHSQLLPGATTGFLTLLESVLTWRGWRRSLYIGNQLHQLKVPVRFIWGEKDAFEKPVSGQRKAAAIADSKFVAVAGAGHSPWLDRPEECSRLAIEMLRD